MKRITFLIVVLFLTLHSFSQTLFTYGKHEVGKDEFLQAFLKNYQPGQNRDSALRNYLELYIRFKLKVQAARDEGMDTLPNQKDDLLSFRRQLEGPYLTDQKELDRLEKEAFERGKKDIRLSHIFIPFNQDFVAVGRMIHPPTREDSLRSKDKINEVFNLLRQGKDFGDMAEKYSEDPAAKTNRGDIGFITVFTLPYGMENVAYSLENGKYSAPFLSRAGYHIFMKTAERPARGRMSLEQILIATHPGISDKEKDSLHQLADSLTKAIRNGASFETLSKEYSDDKTSYSIGGKIPTVRVGQYDSKFENAVFSIPSDGEIAGPVETSYGFHILKRIQYIPVVTADPSAVADLKEQVLADERADLAKAAFEKKVIQKVKVQVLPVKHAPLWQMTDSFRLSEKIIHPSGLTEQTIVARFPGQSLNVYDWLQYANPLLKNKPADANQYEKLFAQFIDDKKIDYYREHLEDYDSSFNAQFSEFRDGNLLFQIMEKKVWSKAGADTAGLNQYYRQHQEKYIWGPSANALVINAADKAQADLAMKQIKEKSNEWQSIASASGGKIIIDSGRYEWSQITSGLNTIPDPGYFTPMQTNQFDNSISFAYVIRRFPEPARRSFEEARGMVLNDFQNEIEEKWIEELKRKYPVKVNQKVFQSLLSAP